MNEQDPVAIVTGATGTIGVAIASRLLAEGWSVALTARTLDDLDEVRDGLGNHDATRISVHGHDVSDPIRCHSVVDEVVGRHGHLDALVNNAGIMVRRNALDTSVDEWNRVLTVNLTGAFIMAQAAYPHLSKSTRGSVVSMSSTHGLLAAHGNIAYSTSKAALIHLTRLLALEWATAGIRVNAVAPTVVPSRQNFALLADPEYVSRKMAAIPMGRPVDANHVAAAVFYLMSDDAASTTGQTLVLDGGESLP